MATTTDVSAHTETLRIDLPDVVHNLLNHLGPTNVALLSGVRDRKLPYKWARREVKPRDDAAGRLIAAHRALLLVTATDSDHVAKLWFVGENPELGEVSPIEALRAGRKADVLAAAKAWTSQTWSVGAPDAIDDRTFDDDETELDPTARGHER